MKNIIIIVVVLVFGVGGVLLLSKNNKQITNTGEVVSEAFSFSEPEYDFGIIKQSGGKVVHDFEFTYNGQEPVEITGVPTSCACTSAKVNKTQLNPGDSAVLTVKFNPNLHEEPDGKFFKTVTLFTEPKIANMPEVKIWVEIDLDLGAEAFELKSDHDDAEEEGEGAGLTSYKSITPQKLATMLKNKDFTLVDVHIPEQEHIKGTDQLIPYNEIEENLDKLPQDKDAKIVLYCRSGGMSRAAAYILAEQGYTNVYDLVGGKQAYDQLPQVSQQVVVTPSGFDFGDIVQSEGIVSTIFTIKNSGETELIVNRLSTSCGCTTAKMDESALQPGEEREMVVTFDPMTHPDLLGEIERVVYLQTSDPARPEVEIDISGNVVK